MTGEPIMKKTPYRFLLIAPILSGILAIAVPFGALSQDKGAEAPSRDRLIEVAREVMDSAQYCALITIDETGFPRARTMDPFPPEDDMTVLLGTNPKSLKVVQIQKNPHVALHYFDAEGLSYVTIEGTARLVNDPKEKAKRWKESWNALYPNRTDAYLLIEVTPKRLEVISYKNGITGDPETWTPPSVEFDAQESK
jgi:general stress protein 26